MKLTADALKNHLKNELLPVYLVTGDEPLIVQECADLIRAKARESGFSERSVFHVEGHFDWNTFSTESNALSLFAEQKLLELRFKKSASAKSFKLPKTASSPLESYLEQPDESNILLIEMPKLDKSETKKKWYQRVEKIGASLSVWPVELARFSQWVNSRAKSRGLNLSQEATQLITERVEGNLLAAAQEIEKLKIIAPSEQVSAELVIESVTESSRYSVFDLIDACLRQDAKKALHILTGLFNEGAQPLPVLGLLLRTLRQTYSLKQLTRNGMSVDQACKKLWILKQQQGQYVRLSSKLTTNQLDDLLSVAFKADRAAKGNLKESPHRLISDLVFGLCTAV